MNNLSIVIIYFLFFLLSLFFINFEIKNASKFTKSASQCTFHEV